MEQLSRIVDGLLFQLKPALGVLKPDDLDWGPAQLPGTRCILFSRSV